ncbi:MAG: DoxX family protein [Chloroflexi bacterium]|nr:DoxX family protein [Chloroflexota bacterium]
MDILFLIGRTILGLYFLYNGVGHFTKRQMLVPYAKSMETPAPELAVPFTGLMLLFGGASLLLGIWMDVGASVLIAFLVPVAFIMHKFWGLADQMMAANQMAHFMKNIALAAALLTIIALHSMAEEVPFSIAP